MVTEGSMTCRIRMAGWNRVLTGLRIPLAPGFGMMSAGVDRTADGRWAKSPGYIFIDFTRID